MKGHTARELEVEAAAGRWPYGTLSKVYLSKVESLKEPRPCQSRARLALGQEKSRAFSRVRRSCKKPWAPRSGVIPASAGARSFRVVLAGVVRVKTATED
jgi:hypothetical protein